VRAFAAEERECVHYQSSTDKVAKANSHLGLHIGLFQGTVIDKKRSFIVSRAHQFLCFHL
jgi:hypothetical protein